MRHFKYLIVLIFCICFTINVYAMGDGNIDSGGGDMSQGTSQKNKWSVGDEGVRVTIIRTSDQSVVTNSIDYTNKSPSIQAHFGGGSKIDYRSGASLSVSVENYLCKKPNQKMPKIITSASGHSSIEEIKRYFCSEYMIRLISQDTAGT